VLPLPDSANARVFLDGSDTDGSGNSTRTNGVAFTDWLNKGTLAGTFGNATAGFRPLFASSLLNGRAGATFDGTDDFLTSSLAASSFTFMHNGAGATVYTVMRTSNATQRVALATCTSVATQTGYLLRLNTTFRPLALGANGSGTLDWTATAAASDFVTGAFNVMGTTFATANTPDADLLVQNISRATANATLPSVLAPTSTLTLCGDPSGAQVWAGDVAAVLVYAGAHDATTRAAVLAFLQSKYGVTFPA
jgi:hypothetical protein